MKPSASVCSLNDVLDTMAVFSEELGKRLGSNLLSVVLFGSAVLGDFRPGEGDIDFIAITQDGLTRADCDSIFDLHDRMRDGEMGSLAAQLEGTYYPLAIVRDPKNATESGCYVGTGRKGWKPIDSNRNSLADYSIARTQGITCHGEDIRGLLYDPSRHELLAEMAHGLDKNIETAGEPRDRPEYAISMIHWAPRVLCYAATGELVSKRKAAEWYISEFPDSRWTSLIRHAGQFRRYPLVDEELSLIDSRVIGEVQEYLVHIRELFVSAAERGCSHGGP